MDEKTLIDLAEILAAAYERQLIRFDKCRSRSALLLTVHLRACQNRAFMDMYVE